MCPGVVTNLLQAKTVRIAVATATGEPTACKTNRILFFLVGPQHSRPATGSKKEIFFYNIRTMMDRDHLCFSSLAFYLLHFGNPHHIRKSCWHYFCNASGGEHESLARRIVAGPIIRTKGSISRCSSLQLIACAQYDHRAHTTIGDSYRRHMVRT